MKLFNLFKLIVALFFLVYTSLSFADDLILYDATGNPAVVVADSNNLSVLYLANGQPVGYVYQGAVFTFKGAHLGWFANGVLWDKNGRMLAFAQASKPASVNLVATDNFTFTKQVVPPIVTTDIVVPTAPTYTYQLSPDSVYTYFSATPTTTVVPTATVTTPGTVTTVTPTTTVAPVTTVTPVVPSGTVVVPVVPSNTTIVPAE